MSDIFVEILREIVATRGGARRPAKILLGPTHARMFREAVGPLPDGECEIFGLPVETGREDAIVIIPEGAP